MAGFNVVLLSVEGVLTDTARNVMHLKTDVQGKECVCVRECGREEHGSIASAPKTY